MSPVCFYLLAERDLYRCSAQGLIMSTVARQYWWSGPWTLEPDCLDSSLSPSFYQLCVLELVLDVCDSARNSAPSVTHPHFSSILSPWKATTNFSPSCELDVLNILFYFNLLWVYMTCLNFNNYGIYFIMSGNGYSLPRFPRFS